MEAEKEYINKDLYNISEKEFEKQLTNDFIGNDFIDQLEWAMLIIQSKFKQIKHADHILPITVNTYDKSYLLSSNLNENQKFFKPFTDLQATPEIFPNINLKYMLINESIQLNKIKELDIKSKRNLRSTYKYVFEIATSYYKKDTECFYGIKSGYQLNDGLFKLSDETNKLKLSDLPNPISLHPNYYVPTDSLKYLDKREIVDICKIITMAYQVAMSMYYEWSIYIKEYDNIGLIIPIEPQMLSEIYKTSLLKFENKKRMLHFVREHYRRKIANTNEDYSIFVNKYLRGEHKFDYRNFYAEIIPPKYDLLRAKTKKKFIDANE